ncbi:metal-dependent transcriptional regulator [Methanofollis fontis]|nr:metal-dependent transcriptional regulator [Methanofollis fontis]
MNSSVREDCLEAILSLGRPDGCPVPREGVVAAVDADPADIDSSLAGLIAEGAVLEEDGGLFLSPEGRAIAELILRKHRVLECFLTEMLGMDTGTASKEACVLEHDISDEAIDRLSTYIRGPRRNVRPPWRSGRCGDRHMGASPLPCTENALPSGGYRRCPEAEGLHSLLEFAEGDELQVAMIRCIGRNTRLIDLGVLPGEHVTLVRKLHNNAVVLRVKGADIALSPEIASTIFVERRA